MRLSKDDADANIKKSVDTKYTQYVLEQSLFDSWDLITKEEGAIIYRGLLGIIAYEAVVIVWEKRGVFDNMMVKFTLPEYRFTKVGKADDVSKEWECGIKDFDGLYGLMRESATMDSANQRKCITIDSNEFILETKHKKYFSSILCGSYINSPNGESIRIEIITGPDGLRELKWQKYALQSSVFDI